MMMRDDLLHILNTKYRLLLTVVTAMLLLSACSEGEAPGPDDVQDEMVELRLCVASPFSVSTRAASEDVQNGSFVAGTEIGVFILDDDKNLFLSSDDATFSSHSYLKYSNLKYTYNEGGNLTFAGDLSDINAGWTNPMLVKNSRIVVIAYAPYKSDMTYEKLMLHPELIVADSQTDADGIKASDFILGSPTDFKNSFVYDGKAAVRITMRHQLSRVVLKFTPAALLEIINSKLDENSKLSRLTASSMKVVAQNAPTSTASAINLDEYKENYEFPSGGFTLGEVTMAQYGEVVMSADNENELVATAIVLPYTYAIDKQPQFEIEYKVGGTTKYITLKLRDLSQSITLGRGQSRTFKLKNPDSFTPGSDDNNSVLDNLFVDDADGNKVGDDGEVW